VKNERNLFVALILSLAAAGGKLAGAVVLAVLLFALFPFLNDLFHGEYSAEKKIEKGQKTILMTMVTNPPPKPSEEPKRMRTVQNSASRPNRATGTSSARFAPDLSLGGGDGPAVESAGNGFADAIYEEGETDEPPMAITRTPLAYPQAAQRARIEGTVEVVFLVNREGRVQDIAFTQVPHKMFEQPIRATIQTWRFKPAMLQGVPVAVRVRQRVDFNLRQ